MPSVFEDPVVADIHSVREEMLASAGGDVNKMMRQVSERQRKSKHRVITQPFRKHADQSDEPEHSRR